MAAEEKIILAEFDIDMEQSIQDTVKLREEFNRLKEQTKLLKETEGETSAEYIKSNATLKQVSAELRSQEAITQKVIAGNRANKGSLDELKAQLAIVSKQWSALSNEERINTDRGKKLAAQKLALTNQLKAEEKATGDTRRNVGNYAEGIREASGAMGTMVPVLGRAATGVKALGVAFKVALGPIGLVIAAIGAIITALTSFFKRGEEGQDKLSRIMMVFRSILDNILDVAGKLGKAIVEALESPKEAVKALGDLIKSQVTNRINALNKMAGAITKIFSKDWKDGFNEFGRAWVDAVTGIENSVDKLKKKGKEFADEMEIAKLLADEEAAIRKKEREYIVENARIAKQSAKARAQAEEEKFVNAEKSIELYNKSFDLDEKILAHELEIAKRKAAAAKIKASLAKSDIETLDEIAKLEADIESKQAAFDEKRRERARRLNMIKKEAFMQEQERQKTLLDTEEILLDQQLRNNERILNDELASNNEKEKALRENVEIQNKILEGRAQLERDLINKNIELRLLSEEDAASQLVLVEQQLADNKLSILEDTIEAGKQLMDEERQRQIEVAQINYENDLAIAQDSIFAQLEVERYDLELKRQQEIEYAQKIGADVVKIEQKYAKAKKEIARAEKDAKLSIVQDFASNIATIAGEGTAITKAAGVAATTIETFRSAQAAYTGMVETLPGPVGIIAGLAAAAASVALGLANVKKILDVKSGLPGDSGGGGGGPITPPTIAPPAAIRENVNPEIGAGIISRTTVQQTGEQIELQPTLIEDDVSNRQRDRNNMNNTAVV
jgi:hypothetical protein